MGYYYTSDHEGSVREMCNSSGAIVLRMGYDLNGITSIITGSIVPTFQWDGMYWHGPSQSYQTWSRIYRPDVAIWDTRDTIDENGGVNLYSFVANDPLDFIDLDGLSPQRAIPYAPKQTVTGTVFGGPNDIDPTTGKPNVSAYTLNPVDAHAPGASLPASVVPYHYPKGTSPGVCIKICSLATGRCTTAPIVDKGPWNTNDPYWNKGTRPKGESEPNGSGLDMTPATAAAMGIPVNWGHPGSPPAINYPSPGFNKPGGDKFTWEFVKCPCPN